MFRSLLGNIFEPSRPTLDNLVFRLHYRVTVGLLLACAVALLWKINYGNPIACVSRDGGSAEFLNDHCWYDGTYTVPSARYKDVGKDIPAPGIAVREVDDKDREYHNVHRWVVIAVLVQAAFFYLPRVIWRSLEGRLVPRWIRNIEKESTSARKELIVSYLKKASFRNLLYAGGCFLCEVLNLINVVAQLFVVSHVLHTSFPSVDLFVKSRAERMDASALISFPVQTKCNLHKYGPSGDLQLNSMLCLMSVNGVMESIFIYQWIWFVLLALLSILAVFYRFVTLLLPPIKVLKLGAKASLTNQATVQHVVRRLGVGEYFVLYVLSKNLDPFYTNDIMEGLLDDANGKEQTYPLTQTQYTLNQ